MADLSRLDQLVYGVDATTHPLFPGCIVGHGNGSPADQVRNYLRSLLQSGQLTDEEFTRAAAKLLKWEAGGGTVQMKPRMICADHKC